MSKMISLRVDEDLLAWADDYALKRGVSRTVLLENALLSFQEDCASGVPDLRERIRAVTRATEPKPGECICPDLTGPEDKVPVRGFKQACPVHGAAVTKDGEIDVDAARAHFLESTAARTGLFAGLRTPESIRAGRSRPAKRGERDEGGKDG